MPRVCVPNFTIFGNKYFKYGFKGIGGADRLLLFQNLDFLFFLIWGLGVMTQPELARLRLIKQD